METLQYQLSDLPPECTKLAADVLVLYYLLPHFTVVKKTTKETQVATVLSWEGIAAPEMLRSTFGDGIAGVGTHYLAAEDQIVKAFLHFAFAVKKLTSISSSSSACSALLVSTTKREDPR